MEKELEVEIREDGTVIFDRQDEGLLDETLEVLSEINSQNDSLESVKQFLYGRKKIEQILGKEIFCG